MRHYGIAIVMSTVAVLAGCSAGARRPASPQPRAAVYDPSNLPAGDRGALIRYGRELIVHTRAHLGQYVVAGMDCQACHVNAGTKPLGGSFVGIAAQFPQWNERANRFIALQDRLAECFLYSMNGRPPPYDGREMLAMVAYITYLSRGAQIDATADPHVRLASISLGKPDIAHGRVVYTQKCSACHGAGGQGAGPYPPLWGPGSFNGGAGMRRLRTMAGFVRYNMPASAPGSLSDREAFDVSAYVLMHGRPKFQRNRLITFPAQPAKYF